MCMKSSWFIWFHPKTGKSSKKPLIMVSLMIKENLYIIKSLNLDS